MNEITSDWCTTEICESSENMFRCRRCVHILFWITFDWCISRWFMKNTLSLSNSLMECNCNFASAAREMIYKLSSTFYYLLLLSLLMMHLKAIWNSDLKTQVFIRSYMNVLVESCNIREYKGICNFKQKYFWRLHILSTNGKKEFRRREEKFMQSWHTFFWAARWSVISWLENFKAIVWSDQNFSTTLIKNMQWRAESAKIEPFSEIFWVPHTKNSKREWFAIKFLGAVSLYPKINANQHFSYSYFLL